MAWYDDAHFKQRAVTEFLVTEKEAVMNLYKRLSTLFKLVQGCDVWDGIAQSV
jgi:hypothetical protein